MKTVAKRVFLIRHGEALHNINFSLFGKDAYYHKENLDAPLTNTGLLQATKLGNKWLNKPESELKIVYGQPDKIEFLETRNRYYIYSSKKYNITCVRKFEVNPNNMVIGFTSMNCF